MFAEPTPARSDAPVVVPGEALGEAREWELSPPQLLHRISSGETEALSELYNRYASLLLCLARKVVGSTQDAEEVLQEVFLQVWRRADTYDSRRSSVPTWLFVITRRRAIDRLRRERTASRTLEAVTQERPRAAVDPEAEDSILHQQRRRRIRQALAGIPSKQRQVLELAYFQGLSQSQIAERVGIPIGTVKTRALLGMRKLRTVLVHEIRDLT